MQQEYEPSHLRREEWARHATRVGSLSHVRRQKMQHKHMLNL